MASVQRGDRSQVSWSAYLPCTSAPPAFQGGQVTSLTCHSTSVLQCSNGYAEHVLSTVTCEGLFAGGGWGGSLSITSGSSVATGILSGRIVFDQRCCRGHRCAMPPFPPPLQAPEEDRPWVQVRKEGPAPRVQAAGVTPVEQGLALTPLQHWRTQVHGAFLGKHRHGVPFPQQQ